MLPKPEPFALNEACEETRRPLFREQLPLMEREENQSHGQCVFTRRDGSGDALLVAPQTFPFLPAHCLQHFTPDVIAGQTVFCGLFIVSVDQKSQDKPPVPKGQDKPLPLQAYTAGVET